MRDVALQVRNVLGVRNSLLVLGFLAANSHVEILAGFVGEQDWWVRLLFLVALDLTVVLVALHLIDQTRAACALGSVHPDTMGVRGDTQLAKRRAAVVVLGLDSDRTDSGLSRLLAQAESLEYLVLLGTPETATAKVVERARLLLALHGRNLPATHVAVWERNHALSVSDFAEAAAQAFGWLERRNVAERDIVADVTSGRRPAGMGVMQAADAARIETQYLANRWDHDSHRPIPGQLSFRLVTAYWGTDLVADHTPVPVAA